MKVSAHPGSRQPAPRAAIMVSASLWIRPCVNCFVWGSFSQWSANPHVTNIGKVECLLCSRLCSRWTEEIKLFACIIDINESHDPQMQGFSDFFIFVGQNKSVSEYPNRLTCKDVLTTSTLVLWLLCYHYWAILGSHESLVVSLMWLT